MMKRNFLSRLKAAVVSAAMIATTFAAPAVSSLTTVTAAGLSVPHTFIADAGKGSKGDVAIPSTLKNAKSITLNFTAPAGGADSVSIGVYGFGTDVAPDYWANADLQEDLSNVSGTFSVTFAVPTAIQGHIEKVGMGIWYPKDSSKWTLNSITADGSTNPGPTPGPTPGGDPELPDLVSSGKSTAKPVTIDGKPYMEITSTLSAKAKIDGETYFDFLLTQGYDEKKYAPYKDADGNTLPERKEGDPINSQKFKYSDFGIYDLNKDNLRLQSFQYDISSEYEMSELQYGGGLNVEAQSIADTEFAKYMKDNPDADPKLVQEGYWYNDQGDDDVKAYGDVFKIDDYNGAYKIKNAGKYATVTWNVPESVQPFVDYSNAQNAVGFQYWWGKDDTQKGDKDLFEIPEIHLHSCICTYTRTVTVPCSETVNKKVGQKLTTAETSNKYETPLTDLELGEYDKLSAIKFSFSSASPIAEFTGGLGISVDQGKLEGSSPIDTVDGFFMSKDITTINTDGTFNIMWIPPEDIKDYIYTGEDSNLMIGYWYGGETPVDVTLDSIDYYVYRSTEDPLEIKDPDGKVLNDGDEITLKVKDTYQLNTNIENCTFVSDRETVATVDETGLIEALAAGKTDVTITTPDGQTVTIKVTVVSDTVTTTAAVTTTNPTTTTATTTTAATTTTVDPNTVVDWMYVLYGDVNLDGRISAADIVELVKYVIANDVYPLKNATAIENGNVAKYDEHVLDSSDSAQIKEYILKHVTIDDLGPKDKSKVLRVPYFDETKSQQF